MTAEFPHTLTDDEKLTGRTRQAQNARAARTAKWLKYEQLLDSDLNDPKCSKKERVELIRAQDTVAERLRILSGAVKPGSRNVSVRELSAAEQQKRIGPRASRPTDYLKDAEATLARAQAMSEPIVPQASPPEPK